LFPCLVADLHHPSSLDVPPLRLSSEQQSDAQRRARTLLLRLLIVSIADARGMAVSGHGKRSPWQRLQQWAASQGSRPGRAGDRPRQYLDGWLQTYFRGTGRAAEPVPTVSPALLARLVEGLSIRLDSDVLRPELLGEVYEGLLARTIDEPTGRVVATATGRKA